MSDYFQGGRSEHFHELDRETRERVISAYIDWAKRHEKPDEPFVEIIDGSTLSPRDLLLETPPEHPGPPVRPRPGIRTLRRILHQERPRAWIHVLNLFAVTVMYGDEDPEALIREIAVGAESGGPEALGT